LLAKAGLLDGKKATTHYCCQEGLAENYPKITVVRGIRFVDNGDILTTEGISAGIDGSLHLVSRLYGVDIARNTAKYMMYNWREEVFETR
jgi:transcriptional regulator GlxA family with amidase domain